MERLGPIVRLNETLKMEEQKERYTRQLLLPEIGEQGQSRLKKARVLIVGIGGRLTHCTLFSWSWSGDYWFNRR